MAREEVRHIYHGTVDDGAFTVDVDPTDHSHTGHLIVKHNESGDVLMEKDVPLMMGAIFGPDVADVAEWQAAGIEVIDQWYVAHGETPPAPVGEQPT